MSVYCGLATVLLVLTLTGPVHMGRIFGGHEAVPHSRPYMAVLEMRMQNDVVKYCGGFLLNEDFVMTAAHCQAKFYKVLLGVHDVHTSHEIQNISVEEVFPHKNYNKNTYDNDIMLLKLSTKARFNKNVTAIDLAGKDDGSLPKHCFVSGWGRSDKNSPFMSHVLMEVNVTLIDYAPCRMGGLYCSQGEMGPAEGDSGGPLVCEDQKAYGVVSSKFIPKSGDPPICRYAKISEQQRWIDWVMTRA